MNGWTSKTRGAALLLSLVGGVALSLAAQAQRAADPDALARAQDESTRPMRWIIENSKIERKKPAAAVAVSTPPDAEVARTDAFKRKRKAPVAMAVAATPAIAARTEPAVAPPPTAQPSNRTAVAEQTAPMVDKTPVAAAPVSLPTPAAPPAPAVNTAKAEAALTPLAAVAKPAPLPAVAPVLARADDKEEELVVVSQAPPQVWSGLCTDGCGKYFYRVAFKVEPNGRVDQVRVVETNYPKFKFLVIRAVAEWQYRPVRTARNEEVLIRLAEQ